jgi:hypothetical protein
MKKILVAVALLGGLSQNLFADRLIDSFSGKLENLDSVDKHVLDLDSGKYKYVLKLTGDTGAKVNMTIDKKKGSGLASEELITEEGLHPINNYTKPFDVTVKNALGKDTGASREVTIKISKKIGFKEVNYQIEIWKK